MNKIKNFFEKKKLDNRFKQAGSGQVLTSTEQQGSSSSRQTQQPVVRQAPTASASRAGEAALARITNQQQAQKKKPSSSTATWKSKAEVEQVRHEVAESMKTQQPLAQPKVIVKDHSLAVDGLFFTCPVYPACLPRAEIQQHLQESLLRDLADEPLMISVTMIHTLNTDKTKKEAGISILGKYLQNILDHPGEEKYRKIRSQNKVFQERVKPLLGVEEFLTRGVGFILQAVPASLRDGEPTQASGDTDEEFYAMSESNAANVEQILAAKEMLAQAEGLEIHLDRNLRVFTASQNASQMRVPDSFYKITSEEAKVVQQRMTNEVEKSKEFRTKAMRDSDNGPKRIYKYCIIRVRLPDGIILQGTFRASEKLSIVKEYVKEQLALDWLPFDLADTIGKGFSDDTLSLSSLKLTPAALLNFRIDQTVTNEIAASFPDGKVKYLKDDVLALVQDL